MKKFVLIFLCLMLILSSCGKKQAQVITTTATTEATATEPLQTESVPETDPTELTKEESHPDRIIDTQYYSLELFGDWTDSCVYELFEMHSGLPVVSLYEKTSHEAFGGGKLCSIQLMPVQDDTYKDFPSYELLGQLDAPDGSYHVIVLYPTDVQFSEDTADAYGALFENIQELLCTLSPGEGVELMPHAPTP